jgi:large conductance mechanosensitive channel
MARKLGLFSDFKAFINKGNVVDLAIAVEIAVAFDKVVGSVVTLITTNALEPACRQRDCGDHQLSRDRLCVLFDCEIN